MSNKPSNSDQSRGSRPANANPSCSRCATHLTEALLSSSSSSTSGPVRSLLDAIGATASIVRNDTNEDGGLAEAIVTVPPKQGVRESDSSRSTTGKKEGGDATLFGTIRRRITGAAADNTAHHVSAAPSTVATSAAPDEANLPKRPLTGGEDEGEPISVSISCQPCSTSGPEGGARAYVRGPHPLSVVLCSNRLFTSAEVEEVLIHELTHVFDIRLRGLDLRDCHQLAYSEVRAAREAECRGSLNRFTESICVKGRAGAATSNMFPGGRGRECVAKVMEAALADRSPFEATTLPDFAKWSGSAKSGGEAGPQQQWQGQQQESDASAASPAWRNDGFSRSSR